MVLSFAHRDLGHEQPQTSASNHTKEFAMAQELGFVSSIWDRLMAASEVGEAEPIAQAITLEQLKASVARDLEGLLNTRTALPEESQSTFPLCRASVLNYGLRDFAGMCLTSSEDRKLICARLKAAIQCHEPRLANVHAEVFIEAGSTNRLDFVITGTLKAQGAAGRVEFNAMLQPSNLHYKISALVVRTRSAKVAA
jgi:type VI secretion system protein ImpF